MHTFINEKKNVLANMWPMPLEIIDEDVVPKTGVKVIFNTGSRRGRGGEAAKSRKGDSYFMSLRSLRDLCISSA